MQNVIESLSIVRALRGLAIRRHMALMTLGLLASCASGGESISYNRVGALPHASARSSAQYGQGNYPLRAAPAMGARIQGLIGLTEVTDVSIGLDPSLGVIQDDGVSQLPMLGGVFMKPLRGKRLKLGIEGGFTVGWEGDTGVVAVGNGSALVVSDNDILLLDFFAGAFAEVFLGERVRVYGGAGPLLQYGRVDLEYVDNNQFIELNESGFGGGIYTRAGIEFDVGGNSLIGFGMRWRDSTVNLGGGLGDLDFQDIQFALTVTTVY